MLFEFIFIGKSDETFSTPIDHYLKKLKHYVPLKATIISPSKEKNLQKVVLDESEKILKNLSVRDFVIVLDERGKVFTSTEFAKELQGVMNKSISKVVFIIGSAYGISESLKGRANLILSFSKFTFTHQMIRLILAEQVYRAMTILKGEKYHH